MPQISEKWEVTVNRKKYILSGDEVKAILNAGEARFVKFKDIVINPAFVESMILVERNLKQISGPDTADMDSEEWLGMVAKAL